MPNFKKEDFIPGEPIKWRGGRGMVCHGRIARIVEEGEEWRVEIRYPYFTTEKFVKVLPEKVISIGKEDSSA